MQKKLLTKEEREALREKQEYEKLMNTSKVELLTEMGIWLKLPYYIQTVFESNSFRNEIERDNYTHSVIMQYL